MADRKISYSNDDWVGGMDQARQQQADVSEGAMAAADKVRAESKQARRGPGRPKGRTKRAGGSRVLTLYVTQEDKDYIIEQAAKRNVSINDYMQGLIDRDKQRHKW